VKCKFSMIFISLILCCVLLVGCASQAEQPQENAASISSEETVDTADEAQKGSPTIYSDSEDGIYLILPAGWKATPIDDTGENMLITTGSDGAPIMMYTSRDLWSLLSEEGEVNLSRAVLNNDLLSLELVADMVGFVGEDAERVELNGYDFFRTEGDGFIEDADSSIAWYRLDNGWFDMFVFADDQNNKFYSQFEEMISSVVYDRDVPAEEDETVIDSTPVYLSGYWSDETFKRNGCTSHPFVLDTPLKMCKGFTIEYEVSEVTDGKMKSDAKFQIFYRTADGTWNKGKEFTLDDNGYASVNQTISKGATVTQVAVHCLNSGNFSWQSSIGIKDPIY